MKNIGRYKIISELGRGGMAAVFRASDPRFERHVAVKVLPQAFLHDPNFRARFEREAKVIAALEHAAIVPVYDFGEEDNQPYIVMRLMSGGSLAEQLKENKFSIDEAVQVVTRVAAALDAAHQKGIIHRDLKPANILFDQYNNAFLSDFGIARLAEAGATLTGSNILGTPAYMSPEQVQGEKDIDGRSDIYALGVIFYQMLVGNAPYQATTPAKVMMMHILEPVPNLMELLPNIAPAVETWFEKVLAKEPEDRFATAGEMAAALQLAIHADAAPPPAADHPTAVSQPVQAAPSSTTAAQGVPSPGTQPPVTPPPSTPYPAATYQQPSRSGFLPAAMLGLVLFGVAAIAIIAVIFLGFSGTGPLSMLAPASVTPAATLFVEPATATAPPATRTATSLPAPSATPVAEIIVPEDTLTPSATATAAPPTATPTPTFTATPAALVIGGADKIAFLDNDEIWVMNVDGSELQQLTDDGAEKFRLGWTPDGTQVTYISGKCVWSVTLENGRLDHVVCFESAKYLDDFSISSDGTQVAISRDLELFVVPYDRDRLANARSRSDLIAMSECPILAPLTTNDKKSVAVTQVRWSNDDTEMAIKVLAPEGGIQVDLIRFTDISSCEYTDKIDEFPATRFDIDGYDKTPYIQNFGYDGINLFSMVSYARNDGFGHLYIYNTNLHRAEKQVNPVDGKCCYRDAQFSPDGRYLIFAHQPYEIGATTQLYYVLFASLGTGANIEPIPLPDTFLTDAKAKPQPALRPVAGP